MPVEQLVQKFVSMGAGSVIRDVDAIASSLGDLDRTQSRMVQSQQAVIDRYTGIANAANLAANAAAGVTAAGVGIGTWLVRSAMQAEGAMAQLRIGFDGNAQAAERAYKWAKQFADTTPYATQSVVDASSRLLISGLDIKKWTEIAGNMAAPFISQGKSITDAVEAIRDAISGGGLDRMKEFGITDKMLKTAGWSGSYKTTEDIETLRNAIEGFVGSKYGNAMKEAFDTTAGGLSTLQGALENLGAGLGTFLAEDVGKAAKRLTELLQKLEQMPESTKKGIAEFIKWGVVVGGLVAVGGKLAAFISIWRINHVNASLQRIAANSAEAASANALAASYSRAALAGGAVRGSGATNVGTAGIMGAGALSKFGADEGNTSKILARSARIGQVLRGAGFLGGTMLAGMAIGDDYKKLRAGTLGGDSVGTYALRTGSMIGGAAIAGGSVAGPWGAVGAGIAASIYALVSAVIASNQSLYSIPNTAAYRSSVAGYNRKIAAYNEDKLAALLETLGKSAEVAGRRMKDLAGGATEILAAGRRFNYGQLYFTAREWGETRGTNADVRWREARENARSRGLFGRTDENGDFQPTPTELPSASSMASGDMSKLFQASSYAVSFEKRPAEAARLLRAYDENAREHLVSRIKVLDILGTEFKRLSLDRKLSPEDAMTKMHKVSAKIHGGLKDYNDALKMFADGHQSILDSITKFHMDMSAFHKATIEANLSAIGSGNIGRYTASGADQVPWLRGLRDTQEINRIRNMRALGDEMGAKRAEIDLQHQRLRDKADDRDTVRQRLSWAMDEMSLAEKFRAKGGLSAQLTGFGLQAPADPKALRKQITAQMRKQVTDLAGAGLFEQAADARHALMNFMLEDDKAGGGQNAAREILSTGGISGLAQARMSQIASGGFIGLRRGGYQGPFALSGAQASRVRQYSSGEKRGELHVYLHGDDDTARRVARELVNPLIRQGAQVFDGAFSARQLP